jgi:hypothetical protein
MREGVNMTISDFQREIFAYLGIAFPGAEYQLHMLSSHRNWTVEVEDKKVQFTITIPYMQDGFRGQPQIVILHQMDYLEAYAVRYIVDRLADKISRYVNIINDSRKLDMEEQAHVAKN